MANPFGTADMAAGYASHRPPIHPRVIKLAQARWKRSIPIARALDVGCGSGLSTKALQDLSGQSIGIDPAEAMVQLATSVAPRANFAVAAAEAIPLPSASVDLITAAGSLNYVDLDRFLAEAKRILALDGILLVYDFAPGRSFAYGPGLDEWFSQFVHRYPLPSNEAQEIDPQVLAEIAPEFSIKAEQFEFSIPLSLDFYREYMMTETNVARAVRAGISIEEIRAWCAKTLSAIWGQNDRDVLFRGYFACMSRLRS